MDLRACILMKENGKGMSMCLFECGIISCLRDGVKGCGRTYNEKKERGCNIN